MEIVLQGQCPLESGDLGVIVAPLGGLRLITFSPGSPVYRIYGEPLTHQGVLRVPNGDQELTRPLCGKSLEVRLCPHLPSQPCHLHALVHSVL